MITDVNGGTARADAPAAPAFPWRVVFAGVALLILWSYTPPVEPRYRFCGFHWLTGHPCPLCGLTHAVFALAKGQFREAVGFNALSPLAFLMLFGLFLDRPVRGRLWTLGIGAFAVYGVIRIFVAGA